jgi:Holliday junction resolvase RusA-like endonuclease
MIEFYAIGIPKGQPRPRAFARKMGNKFVARVFESGTAESWKSAVAAAAKEKLPMKPMEGPLHVQIIFYFPRPKAHFTKKGKRPDAPAWHTAKPDADNAAKAVMDALTILGAWEDDSQVCRLECKKFYNDSQFPGASISIHPLLN